MNIHLDSLEIFLLAQDAKIVELEAKLNSPHRGGEVTMFSVRQKREISAKVQRILQDTQHPELPQGEIQFYLHVAGAEPWSFAEIRNNGAVLNPDVNPHNEAQDKQPTVAGRGGGK